MTTEDRVFMDAWSVLSDAKATTADSDMDDRIDYVLEDIEDILTERGYRLDGIFGTEWVTA